MATRPTVLLIDDNAAVSEIVGTLLARNGYDVVALDTVAGAPGALEEHQIDVIVSDVRLPDQDGLSLVRRIRGDPASADIPIVLLTAMKAIEDEFDGYLAGADAYMTKPFRARELLAVIDKVLNRKAAPVGATRRGSNDEVARVLAVVSDDRRRMVAAAMKLCGYELDFESTTAKALARVDRERFHLLVCDTVQSPSAVADVREFLMHFALALPVIFLHPRAAAPVLPANDPQFHALRVPATPADLAELARRTVTDFNGPV